MYHVNSKGNTGLCQAEQGNCPFGGDSGSENHFASEQEARSFYEDAMLAQTFATAKKKAAGPGIVPIKLRADYSFMMARRSLIDLREDIEVEAILLMTPAAAKDKHHGPRGGSLLESTKLVGKTVKSLGNVVKVPFLREAAGKLLSLGKYIPLASLGGTTGMALGGGVIAIATTVAASYFGQKSFTQTKNKLLNAKFTG